MRTEIAIVGAGCAGSILARALAACGREVTVLERSRHPRFALGESTTPLANLALDRLARRYGLEDLHQLAAHGRWLRTHPQLMRGLKRGFTFYAHTAGRRFEHRPDGPGRLLVAASPDDEIADTQWLRADVDAHLAAAAEREGVEVLQETAVRGCRLDARGRPRLSAEQEGGELEIDADYVVDASGPAAVVARALGAAPPPRRLPRAAAESRRALVFGHFLGVPPFSEVVPDRLPRSGSDGEPYPEQWAAVHHLLDVGWMYQLRFDDGRTSAGVVLDCRRAGAQLPEGAWDEPESLFETVLERQPDLARQFAHARPTTSLGLVPSLAWRSAIAAGERFALLPHTYAFSDPMFSTGLAWSFLGVERLAEVLGGTPARRQERLQRYGALLAAEADHVGTLIEAATASTAAFEQLRWLALLYFAAASWGEMRQRLLEEDEIDRAGSTGSSGWHWSGFLGADDPVLRAAVDEASAAVRSGDGDRLARAVRGALEERDLIGLGASPHADSFPVELGPLFERCTLLGLTRSELERRLPRLRGVETAV